MGQKRRLLVVALLGSLIFPALAHSQYYTFSENHQSRWQDPHEIFNRVRQEAVELLNWSFHDSKRPVGKEKYNRKKHFGSWIVDQRQDNCYNTRAQVLIRDSIIAVKFASANPCRVESGRWADPYGGGIYKSADDIQIDHVVALKNAYDSGAWSWKRPMRCLFTNFIGHQEHLISAYSSENQEKADKAPDQWMPSDSRFACQHLHNWLMVKYIWNLNMTEQEASAISRLIQKHQCPSPLFQPSVREVAQARRAIEKDISICQ